MALKNIFYAEMQYKEVSNHRQITCVATINPSQPGNRAQAATAATHTSIIINFTKIAMLFRKAATFYSPKSPLLRHKIHPRFYPQKQFNCSVVDIHVLQFHIICSGSLSL